MIVGSFYKKRQCSHKLHLHCTAWPEQSCRKIKCKQVSILLRLHSISELLLHWCCGHSSAVSEAIVSAINTCSLSTRIQHSQDRQLPLIFLTVSPMPIWESLFWKRLEKSIKRQYNVDLDLTGLQECPWGEDSRAPCDKEEPRTSWAYRRAWRMHATDRLVVLSPHMSQSSSWEIHAFLASQDWFWISLLKIGIRKAERFALWWRTDSEKNVYGK